MIRITIKVTAKVFTVLTTFMFCFTPSYSQVASDYYNKPQQELFASISQESTYVHKAGFLPCFNSVYNWANKNRVKYNFLSVSSNDSLGIVRVTSIIDCQVLSSRSTQVTCNLIVTSCSSALKIGFADLKSKESCGTLWRVSIVKELVHIVTILPDSIITPVVSIPHISRGLLDSGYLVSFDKALAKVRVDSLRVIDSIRLGDSISRVAVSKDSVEEPSMAVAQRTVDSISDVISRDSIIEYKMALVMFKHQLDLKRSVSVEIKLECLEFLIRHNLRTSSQVEEYLTCLGKFCSDKQALYYAARLVVSPSQKYMCVRYYKKAQDVSGKVQSFLVSVKK